MKSRIFDIRIPIVLVLNVIFVYMIAALNTFLARYSVYISVPALFLAAPCVFLSFPAAMGIIVFTAFLAEANTDVRDGLTAALWLIAGGTIYFERFRLRSLEGVSLIAVFQVANIIILGAGAALFPIEGGFTEAFFVRWGADALFSAAALFLFVPFAIELQKGVFTLLNIDLNAYGRLE